MKSKVIYLPVVRQMIVKKIMREVRRRRSNKKIAQYVREFYTEDLRSRIKLVKENRGEI